MSYVCGCGSMVWSVPTRIYALQLVVSWLMCVRGVISQHDAVAHWWARSGVVI